MHDLSRGQGQFLWRQIEETLVGEIAAGVHAPGARFPTEHVLAARFGVNRHTVRRAIAELVERGLVRVERGRGGFVAEHAIDYAVGPRTRFSENLMRQGRRPDHRVLRLVEVPASPSVARMLKIKAGAPTIHFETTGEADGRPINISSHTFPADRAPGLFSALETVRSITRALARIGIEDYRRRWTKITARTATPEEAGILRTPPNRPILVAESVNVDGRNLPIDYGYTRFAAERVQLVVES